jgi:hypothetical protein
MLAPCVDPENSTSSAAGAHPDVSRGLQGAPEFHGRIPIANPGSGLLQQSFPGNQSCLLGVRHWRGPESLSAGVQCKVNAFPNRQVSAGRRHSRR